MNRRHLQEYLRLRRKADDSAGASLLQFALVFPILMLFAVGFIDLARVLAIRGVLTKGAQDGLAVAMTVPNLDVDIKDLPTSDVEYSRYLEARRRVIAAATGLPLGTLLTNSGTPSSARLLSFTYADPNSAGPPSMTVFDGAMLRPGERVQITGSTPPRYVGHGTVIPDPSGNPPPQPQAMLMAREPILVELHAEVDFFLPFFDNIVVSGSASGFREKIPRGPFLDVTGVEPSETPTPVPTDTPIPGPTPTAEPPPPTVVPCTVTRAIIEDCLKLGNLPNDNVAGPGNCPCDVPYNIGRIGGF